MVRCGRSPLAQAANRISEFQEAGILNSVMRKKTNLVEFKKEMKNFDSNDASLVFFLKSHEAVIYSEVVLPTFTLSAIDDKNRWFLSKSFEVVSIKYIIKTNLNASNLFLYGQSVKNQSDYFQFPLRSSELNIYQSDCSMKEPTFFCESDIYCKMVKVNFDDVTSVFIPLYPTIMKKN